MTFKKGESGNILGRPKKDPNKIVTNRTRREETLLALVRKFQPHVSKAVLTASRLMENEEASEQNRLRAAALILQTYKDLVKDVYNKDYDSDEAEAIQENNGPVFSLHVLPTDNLKTGTDS